MRRVLAQSAYRLQWCLMVTRKHAGMGGRKHFVGTIGEGANLGNLDMNSRNEKLPSFCQGFPE